jgi:two-component system probable response regulator PhcQ
VAPAIDWRRIDHADLRQSEAERGIAIGRRLAQCQLDFGPSAGKTPEQALVVLASAVSAPAPAPGVLLAEPGILTGLLDGPAQQAPGDAAVAWLAWLLWWGQPVQLRQADGGWAVEPGTSAAPALPDDWLADAIEQIGRAATAA